MKIGCTINCSVVGRREVEIGFGSRKERIGHLKTPVGTVFGANRQSCI